MMHLTKHLCIAGAVLLLCSASWATTGQLNEALRQRIEANPLVATGNNNLYPVPDPRQAAAKAPKGFKPFYISHYSRHGSRWLISESDYSKPQNLLHEQHRKGNLTALGEDVMRRLDIVCKAAAGRYEELTPEGAGQQRGIAERMYRNYPEVLGGNARVSARSTTVIRCILSMNSFTNALAGCNRSLAIDADASKHDMYYMNWYDPERVVPDVDLSCLMDSLYRATVRPQRFMESIFKDAEGIDPSFFQQMYMICGNVQGTPPSEVSFLDLFTTEELYELYFCSNTGWYFNHGNCPAKNNMRPFVQTNLLRTIIAQADCAIEDGIYAADLRFGHDGNLSSLVTLMNLNGLGASVSDLDRIADVWSIDRIIPMAANIQMVFYRNRAGEVLVHFALNEQEATLPIDSYRPAGKKVNSSGQFYLWSAVKAYWEGILAASPVQ